MTIFSLWFTIAVIAISFLLKMESTHYKVVVGILSSRDHSVQRSIFRTAFEKHFGNESILLKFIVAKHACEVPKHERVSVFGCLKSSYNGTAAETVSLHDVNRIEDNVFKPMGSAIGFDFDVYHDVVVDKLGIIDYNNDGIKGNVKVIVYNRITEDPVLAVAFLSFSGGQPYGNYRFKSVANGNLSAGFKGTLVVEGLHQDDLTFLYRGCDGSDNGLIKINCGIRMGQHVGEFPPNILKPGCLLGPTFSFKAVEPLKVTDYSDYKQSDLNHSCMLLQQEILIRNEIKQYGDIVLVDTAETYRNLPDKMLKFYEWLSTQSYDFVLKSDDDCYINVPGVLRLLEQITMFDTTNLWIGNFREYYGLHREGKWAEQQYKSVSYPPFACGSGYLLSRDIVKWLVDNQNKLNIYQGEDTSLGIWLSAIAPNRIQDDRFQCARTCHSEMLTLPENSVLQLRELYASIGSKSINCN